MISQLPAPAAYSNNSPAMMDSPPGYHKLLFYKLLFVTVLYQQNRKISNTKSNSVVYTLCLSSVLSLRCSCICVRFIPVSKSIDDAVYLKNGAAFQIRYYTVISLLCLGSFCTEITTWTVKVFHCRNYCNITSVLIPSSIGSVHVEKQQDVLEINRL